MQELKSNAKIAAMGVAVLWCIYIINLVLPGDLRTFGIRPRTISSLPWIITAPFLHVDLVHLIFNSIPLFILSLIALSYDRLLAIRAMLLIVIIGGFGTWLFGTPGTIHIGASGVVFGLMGFLLLLGFFRHEPKAIIASVAVFFLYGGSLVSLLLPLPGISWSSHVFGFATGTIVAYRSR